MESQKLESRVAPLDSNIAHYWGVTINVSPKKILCGRRVYASLSEQEQKDVILDAINDFYVASSIYDPDFQYVFEMTKAGMVHLHGLFICTEAQIRLFQTIVHKKLGFPSLAPSICCTYEQTWRDPEYWRCYMSKCQSGADSPSVDAFMF